jgi:hypothetical protein
MFRNFLSYQIALGFEQSCSLIENVSPQSRDDIRRCAHQSVHYLTRAIHAGDPIERSRSLFLSLTYLRDCKDALDAAGVEQFDVRGRFLVLHGRLEQLCWESAGAEKGQLRMLG